MRRIPEFTDHQMEVLDMIAEDMSVPEIAKELHLSDQAIKQLRQRVRDSIGLECGQSLKEWLYRNGWSKPEL